MDERGLTLCIFTCVWCNWTDKDQKITEQGGAHAEQEKIPVNYRSSLDTIKTRSLANSKFEKVAATKV